MPFVESDHTIDVTGIEALDDETAQVVRLGGVFALGVLVSLTAYGLFNAVPKEFSPTEDRGIIIIPIQAPEGASLVGRLPRPAKTSPGAGPRRLRCPVVAGRPLVPRGGRDATLPGSGPQ